MISLLNHPSRKISLRYLKHYETSSLIIEAAAKRKIQAQILIHPLKKGKELYIRLQKGKQTHWISPPNGYFNSKLSCKLAMNKDLTNQILKSAQFPTPESVKINEISQIDKIKISPPWVVKPITEMQGRDVLVNIESKRKLKKSCFVLLKTYGSLLLEKFIEGDDFRLLVLRNQFLGTVKRIPPIIIGDGVSSIQEIINRRNSRAKERNKQMNLPKLSKIKIDIELKRCLVKQKLTLESFITKDRSVCVRQNANFSTGGSVEDVSDKVHPKNILLAQRAIKILGMEIGGVDVIANNIDTPITETGGKIIEINSSPSLSLHVCHGQSKSKKYLLADKIIDYLFDLTRRF